MYPGAVLDYALSPARRGSAGPGAVAGSAGDAVCGDRVRIELRVERGTVVAARHRSHACPHATAAAAACCELAEGGPLLAAARVGTAEVCALLGVAGGRGRACVALAVDALHDAIGRAAGAAALAQQPGRVAVAMSGGVDSAVALLKAIEAGC